MYYLGMGFVYVCVVYLYKNKNNINPKTKVMVSFGDLGRTGVVTGQKHIEDPPSAGNVQFLIQLKGIQAFISLVYKLYICHFMWTIIIIKNKINLKF